MNAWTIGSGTLALIFACVSTYYQMSGQTAKATAPHYSIVTPGEAESVGLCVPAIRGRGEAPQKGSLWLVVHGLANVGYYPVRQVQTRQGEEEWSASKVQVGSAETEAGQRYELVLWQIDEDLTEAIEHIPVKHRVFNDPPASTSVVGQPTTVVRRADTRSCGASGN